MFVVNLDAAAVFWVLVLVAVVIGWWRILSRVGYPGFLSLLLLVPVVNLALFLFFAYLQWPRRRHA